MFQFRANDCDWLAAVPGRFLRIEDPLLDPRPFAIFNENRYFVFSQLHFFTANTSFSNKQIILKPLLRPFKQLRS